MKRLELRALVMMGPSLTTTACQTAKNLPGSSAADRQCRTELIFADRRTTLDETQRLAISRIAETAISTGMALRESAPTPIGPDQKLDLARQQNIVNVLQSYEKLGLKVMAGFQLQDFQQTRSFILSACP